VFLYSSRRRHTRSKRDWSSDVCSSDLVHTDPDVLIVDEALSVGDDTFANKCIRRMEQFREEGRTIFFVSHSIGQIQKMCNKALWIHYGEVREYGSCIPVVGLYARFVRGYN